MDTSRFCEKLAATMKIPIREYDAQSKLQKLYGDFNAVPGTLSQDLVAIQEYQKYENKQAPLAVYVDHRTLIVMEYVTTKGYFVMGSVSYPAHIDYPELVFSVDQQSLYQGATFLYEFLTGSAISEVEIITSQHLMEKLDRKIGKTIGEVTFEFQENNQLHNPYDQEIREQESIRKGDVHALYKSFEESYAGRLAILSKEPLQSAKNLGIVVLAISTRAAIEGGIHPEIAFMLSDSYILNVDEATNQEAIYSIVRKAEVNFTELVAQQQKNKTKNPIILRTKDYISQHLHEKISLKELSKALNINSSYLATTFKQEMDQTIHQYIIKEKMNKAEIMLKYSTYSLDEIATFLAFSSQSHFGTVFRKQFGLSPMKFRTLYGIKEHC